MRKGFTLLELIIVIAILAVLAGAMVPLFKTTRLEAQFAKARADLEAIKSAAVMLHYDTGQWRSAGPADDYGLISDPGGRLSTGWDGPYLTDWATSDPYTGSTYVFENGSSNELYARSYGPDGASQGCETQPCDDENEDNCDVCVTITADRTQ